MHATMTFILMFILWVLMSGKFDAFHLTLGLVSSAMVAALSANLLFQDRKSLPARVAEGFRFAAYAIWLLAQITIANMHVIKLALTTRPMEKVLNPHIFTFKTFLKNDFSRFVLANSITLTPGTVTIRVEGDVFYVHAIDEKAAGDLADQESISDMERRIAAVFEPETLKEQAA